MPRPERGVGQGTFSMPPGGGSLSGLGSAPSFISGTVMAPLHLPPLPLPQKLWNNIARELELSPQQKRIVELILRNACDKQIAIALGRGKPTIRTHLDRVFRRLHVEDRGELVLLIFRLSHQPGHHQ